jgi:DsbC/DsbD-like thiol-disulfide interchange protein
LKGNDLNFAIKKNIKKAIEELAPAKEQEEEMALIIKPYVEEKEAAFKKASIVDGTPKTKFLGKQSVYDVQPENEESLKKELAELTVKHQGKIDEYDERQKEFQLFLKQKDSTFEITKVKRHHVPADITTEDMELIFDIIQDKEGE